HGEAEPAGVALVVRRGQDDGGGALAQLVRNGERVEQKEVVAELDRVRRDELRPPLLLVPVWMRRLPLPDTGAQLMHGRDAMSAGMEKTTDQESATTRITAGTVGPPGSRTPKARRLSG